MEEQIAVGTLIGLSPGISGNVSGRENTWWWTNPKFTVAVAKMSITARRVSWRTHIGQFVHGFGPPAGHGFCCHEGRAEPLLNRELVFGSRASCIERIDGLGRTRAC